MRAFDEALSAYRRGDYAEAERRLRLALLSDPKSRDLLFNLVLVHERRGHLEEALAGVSQLLSLETAPEELERLRALQLRLRGASEHARSPSSAPPLRPNWDGWTLGVGVSSLVLLTGGVALSAVAWQREFNRPSGEAPAASSLDLAMAGNLALSVGALGALTTCWLGLGRSSADEGTNR